MKLNGTFTIREIADEILAIPVGKTALELNGMIVLNPVSKVIWECLEFDTTEDCILSAVLANFEVEEDVAKADVEEVLTQLKRQKLIVW